VMKHFWQLNRESIENTCTFAINTCLGCARAWDPSLVPDARPICIFNSYDAAQAIEHYYAGNPYSWDNPEWDPLGCSYFQAK